MKTRLLFLFIFLGLIPIGCRNDDCDFPPAKDFRIVSFELKTKHLNRSSFDTNSFYPYDSLVKTLSVKERTTIAKVENINHGLFASSSFACEPNVPRSIETIKELEIISQSNFELNYSDSINIGDTISRFFRIGTSSLYYHHTHERFLNSSHRMNGSPILLQFDQKPIKNIDLKFDLVLKLSSGAVHRFDNQTLRIK